MMAHGFVRFVFCGRIWMWLLMTMLVAQVATFAIRVSTIAHSPLTGALWSTWSFILILIVGWSADVHVGTMARYKRPRVCVVHGGIAVPVKLKTLGRDPDGYWSWLIVDRAVHPDDDVFVADAPPPHSALYFLTTSGALVRGHRDD